MLNVSYAKREKCIKEADAAMQARILTGKQSKLDTESKQQIKRKALLQRFKFEETRYGGWKRIYPCEDISRNTVYEGLICKANNLWDEFTTGNKAKNKLMHQDKR